MWANSPTVCRIFEDFHADAASTLLKPWGTQDTSAAGSPTLTFVADALNGEFNLAHDGTSEQQALTLYFADQLVIDPTMNAIFEARLKINFAGATFSADQRIVMGFCTARPSYPGGGATTALDAATQNAWFRIEGANLNILWETDDGSTDDDDNDSTFDIVDNTYLTLRIELCNLSDIGFFVNGVKARDSTAAAAFTSSHKMQPFIEIQRDAGTEAESVVIDYVLVEWDRG